MTITWLVSSASLSRWNTPCRGRRPPRRSLGCSRGRQGLELSCKQYVNVPSGQEEYYEVAVVSNWEELVNGGQDENVTIQIFAVFIAGVALHTEKYSWDCARNNQENTKYELREPHKPKKRQQYRQYTSKDKWSPGKSHFYGNCSIIRTLNVTNW